MCLGSGDSTPETTVWGRGVAWKVTSVVVPFHPFYEYIVNRNGTRPTQPWHQRTLSGNVYIFYTTFDEKNSTLIVQVDHKLTLALTFSNEAGLMSEKHMRNTSWERGMKEQDIQSLTRVEMVHCVKQHTCASIKESFIL